MSELRVLFLAATFLSVLFAAEEKCPWLNAATAAGALGGAVKTSVTETFCEFVRREGSSESALRIEVESMAAPGEFASRAAHCGSGAAALKAIGNEAVACTYADKKELMAEQVVGRVRNQVFLVRVSINNRSVTAGGLREKARKIAEQVAGFLF